MKVLVNALSATAPSGQHVLFGHVRQLARWTVGEHEFHILACPRTTPADANFGPNVHWHLAPQSARNWLGRTLWETKTLPGWMTSQKIDLYFTPTGTILPRSPVPQISLAQNPWCMTTAVTKSFRERCKALAQRSAYRKAQRSADLMIYNSAHMQRLYRQNAAGRTERRGLIVHQGIHDKTHDLAARTRDPQNKDRLTILSVSVMARWKNCETLLRAVRRLHDHGIPAKLRLVGHWPDPRYRQQIESEISWLQLDSHVTLEGHLSLTDLHAAYRTARVYCLLSRCESFGIPAIEAQAFGTPVVGSKTCAMPEIGGNGGIYVDPNDVEKTATTLKQLLTEDAHWFDLSLAAIENSRRFRWQTCSQPLQTIFRLESIPEHVSEIDSQTDADSARRPQSVANAASVGRVPSPRRVQEATP
ncbi:MAG: glycosyltransferase [Planctomycetes bacterium]|nr:glycosyltransferase [Planctomycetota bacterium]